MSTTSTISKVSVFAVLLLVGLGATTNAIADDGDGDQGSSHIAGDLWLERAPATNGLDGPQSHYATLAREVGPAVVNVLVSYGDSHRSRRSGPRLHPRDLAEGSGFVIHPDGYVVTNFHVIDDAHEVTVNFEDGREYRARVIGVDALTDIALMKIDTDDELPSVTLGDSTKVNVGDYVVAIGNPLGLSHSMTAGIVSALDRRDLPIEGQQHQGNFIQVDAPINPGNSGGPLIDMNGDVIGINAAINRQGQGISFAIPINLVKTLLPQLKEQGYVNRSWLGVRIQPLDAWLANSFGLSDNRGALVTEVVADSPASRAEIKPRDVVLAVDGVRLRNSDDLPLMIATSRNDTTVALDVIRDGRTITVDVDLEAQPDQSVPDLPGRQQRRPAGVDDDYYGISVDSRDNGEGDATEQHGVVITDLSQSSPARKAGLEERDVILKVGSTDVDSEEDFQRALADDSHGEAIRLKLLRNGRTIYVAFPR